MSLEIPITIIGAGSALLTYALIERRINQRACPHCGFRVSTDTLEEQCPRCGRVLMNGGASADRVLQAPPRPSTYPKGVAKSSERRELPPGAALSAGDRSPVPGRLNLTRAPIERFSRIALFAIPLLILTVDGSIAIYRRAQPRTDKAIRLAQGSSSRIENFTVQQYIYATLSETGDKGAKIIIDGWRAQEQSEDDRSVMVEFGFTKEGVSHRALWAADLSSNKVRPTNEDACDLSWNSFEF